MDRLSIRHEIGDSSGAARDGDHVAPSTVGKRTLVQMLEATAWAQPSGEAPGHAPGEAQRTAAHVDGPAQPLPHREHIQALFGQRGVTGVQAHVAGPAAEATGAMGAAAAHGVQPRKGGVGQAMVQRKESGRIPQAGPAGADLPSAGAGAPLHDGVREKMEGAFGQSFSDVRIHEGPRAGALCALAYTQGADIHFAPGQYQPTTPGGQALLGHELAHVVQQRQGRVSATTQSKAAGVDVNDDPALEREADEMGAKAARGERVSGGGPAGEGRSPSTHPGAATAPVQRKLGVEIEVSGSAFELQREAQAQDMSQSQTVATRAAGGKNAYLKAEGPKDGRALAEFVTDAYSYDERAGLLAAVELLAAQATNLAAGALGGWTVQGGDAVNILDWPEAPMGGFQVTISPVDNTVVHLYNAFPAHKTTTYSREAGVTQKPVRDEEDAQLEKTAAAIQKLRVLTARNADIAFWKWFSTSGLAIGKLPTESPGELFNFFVSLSEAMSWRFGLLLKSWGTTFKNTLDVMPKFDFVTLIDKQLKPFLGEDGFEDKAPLVKQRIIAAFGEALAGQQDATMSVVAPSIEMALGFSGNELVHYNTQLQNILEEEQSVEETLSSGFLDKATVELNIASKQREIAVLKDLLSGGIKSTFADIAAVVSGKAPFLGDIRHDNPKSVMQDEGSLIAPDHNAPEGAFEHRNPFDSKVAAADWVDATTQFLALLDQKGVRY